MLLSQGTEGVILSKPASLRIGLATTQIYTHVSENRTAGWWPSFYKHQARYLKST
jgi:hypothetical protein